METDFLSGYKKGMDDAAEIITKKMPNTGATFYEQGLSHAVEMVRTLSLKYKLPEAFLLELSVELNKLKKVLEPTVSR